MRDEIMTIKDIAHYLKINEKTIYKLTKQGKLPAIKIGGLWRFKKEAIDHWLMYSNAQFEDDRTANLQRLNLKKNERKALEELKKKLHAKFPEVDIILFGSHARGDSESESDIDVLILINALINNKIEEEITRITYSIELKYEIVFGKIIENKKFWNSPLAKALPLHQNIDSEGVRL